MGSQECVSHSRCWLPSSFLRCETARPSLRAFHVFDSSSHFLIAFHFEPEVFLFTFFILLWLLSAFYSCKSLLPTIGRLDPRVPPGSVLLHSTVKLALECEYICLAQTVSRVRFYQASRQRAPY